MQLIWFRQDLRIQDQTALWHATQSGQCIAFIVFSTEQWKLHDDAAIKINFYLRQVQALQQQLERFNIPLLILECPLWHDLAPRILKLALQLKISSLHANIETGANELKRDSEVTALLRQYQIAANYYHDRTLFPLGSIRNQSQSPYKVFSAFKKQCYAQLSISLPTCFSDITAQNPLAAHDLWAHSNNMIEDYLKSYALDKSAVTDPNFNTAINQKTIWPVGEAHAKERLAQFIADQLNHYAELRDIPNIAGTSQLSPYLNVGIISIRQCVQALFSAHDHDFHIDNIGQQTWLDELLWREFYQHLLFDFPELSKHTPFKSKTQHIQWRDAPEDLNAWQQGQTGIPIVDAGMRQMLNTGWMHNRVRMICAMFLSKNLLMDWRLGEQWFMQHLIDGDLAANNGGWQWCASTGVDASPYFRIFNPVTQSQRFDPDGDYIRHWLPELARLDAKTIHDPYAKNPDLDLDYPRPIVDLKQSRLRAIEAFKNI